MTATKTVTTEITLHLSLDEVKQLKQIMACDIDIPKLMATQGYSFDKMQHFMGHIHAELRRLNLTMST